MKTKHVLSAVAALLILGLTFLFGYRTYEHTHPITTSTDTLYIWDTITYEIPVDHYHVDIDTIFVPDSILIPAEVDTLAILADYYRTYEYQRSWSDSTISVNFSDFISRNRIEHSTLLNYKLLKPQTTIINKTEVNNYSTYLNISARSDYKIQNPEISISIISRKFSGGIGYMPRQEALTINLGYNVLKLK